MTTENTPIFSVAKYSSIQPAIDAGTLKYPAYILVRDGDDWTWAFVDKDSTIKRVKGYQQEAVIVVDTLPMENVRTDVFYFCNDIGYLYINGSFVPVFQDVTAVEAKVEANTNAISNLDSAVNTRIASAKTELESKITTAQDTLQATIDAVDEKANTNATAIGDLDDLGTTQKGDLVAAINEVKASVSTGGGAVSDEQIAEAVYNYLLENPIEGVTDEQVAQAVSEYMVENPIETGATSWNDLEDRPFYSYEDYYLLFSEQGLGGRLNILGEMMVRLPGNSAVIRVYDTATGDLLYEDIFDKQTVSLKFEGYNITWYGNGKLANDFDEFVGNNLGIGEEKYTEGKVVLYRVIDDNVDSKLDEWRFVIDDSVKYMSKYGAMDIEVLDINKETKYATLDENFIPDTIARKSDIPIVDEALYESSPNPVQNKVVAKKFSELSDTVNNKLDSSKLTEAIDTALTQAKESGEFKGDKGDKGDDGKSAYEYAKDGGYTGTEEEFAKKLAQENPTREEFSQLQDTIPDKATLENNVIKFFKSGETDTELFSVDISTIGGTSGLDLNNLTLSVSQVGEYQRLSMSDGTTTKTVDIPITVISDEQVQTAVNVWFNEHPEAVTTIADGSVTLDNMAYLKVEEGYSKNLWNPENTVDGFLGQSTPSTAYATTDYFIPVKVGKKYCTHKKTQTVWGYDSEYNRINTSIVLNTEGVVLPEDVKYIKVSFATASSEEQLLACAIYEAEKYELLFTDSYVPKYNVSDECYMDLLVTNGIKAQNLIQKRTKGSYGGVVDLGNSYTTKYNTANYINIYNMANNSVSEIVDINEDTNEWSAYGVRQVLKIVSAEAKGFWFTATGTRQSKINLITPSCMGFGVGENMYIGFYARYVGDGFHGEIQIENGSTFINNYAKAVLSHDIRLYEFEVTVTEDNVDNGFTFRTTGTIKDIEITNMYITDKPNSRGCIFVNNNLQEVLDSIISEKFIDKTLLACGDSITNAGFYLSVLNKWYPFGTINNVGVNGSCMCGTSDVNAFCNRVDEELAESIANADVITIQYGTNDIRYIGNNFTMGSLKEIGSTDFDKTTVYGAWQYSLEKILTYNPTAKIIVIIPPSWTNVTNWSLEEMNLIEEYCNAVKEVCNLYKIKCIDLHASCGWNKFTQMTLTPDGVHPSREFGTQCASIIAPAFEEITFNDQTK